MDIKQKLIEYRIKNPGKLYSIKDKTLFNELVAYDEYKDLNWKEKAYSILHGDMPVCVCGNSLKLTAPTADFLYGKPSLYCSNKCRSSDPSFRSKVNNTYFERYGGHPFSTDETKVKIRKTNMERYGTENPSNSFDIKEKIRLDHIEKYGVDHPWKNKDVRNRIAETNIERYGSANVFGSEKIKEKIKETNLSKYGVENPSSNPATRIKSKITQLLKRNADQVITQAILNDDKELFKARLDELSCSITKKSDLCHLSGLGQGLYATLKHFGMESEYIVYDNASSTEKEVHDFVSSLGLSFEIGNRTFLGNKKEIDVLIHSHKLAIEFNGMHWHSYKVKPDPKYHLNKTNIVESKGYQLLHIFENEWDTKNDIWKSIICAKLGIFKRRLYARKCKVKEISSVDSRSFLDKNHLSGFSPASTHLGLFYENELVSVMSFGKSRFKQDETEIIRFAATLDTQVVGGLSKLMKHIVADKVVCFADRRIASTLSSGYSNLFSNYELTPESFWVIEGYNLRHRLNFTKQRLIEELGDGYNHNISAFDNMIQAGHKIIFDCGNIKFTNIR